MTREKEDELLAQLAQLRSEAGELIGSIVEARARGERDEKAMNRLAAIWREQTKLTQPKFEELVA